MAETYKLDIDMLERECQAAVAFSEGADCYQRDIMQLIARIRELERDKADWLKANAPGGWIDDLRRASQPGSGEAWQPIETAPKDGTEIMLAKGTRVTQGQWVDDRYLKAAEYHNTTGEYLGLYQTGECIDAHWMTFDGGFREDDQPTHWMPLPAAPCDAARASLDGRRGS